MADPAAVRPPDHGGLLVVDDEPFLRDAVAASLRFLGFEVTTGQTGAEALRLARDRPFDLVVLDVMLPDTTASRSSPGCAGTAARFRSSS